MPFTVISYMVTWIGHVMDWLKFQKQRKLLAKTYTDQRKHLNGEKIDFK